ncbi:undecaprenyl-phosphate glucose phosphotransferase [Flammeovirgaceae bacterium SG7u.111]|nr:undecaprenyl-phosphate glucose phosphotransferase [Flammeovirgaceae bacterium SG7u.132]WPO36771.1 undecaprenyl-phosphate glucose phosphotransferase [Flammeovirgaceae bacterium SG7u.111]
MESIPYFIQGSMATSTKIKPSSSDSPYLNWLFAIADLVILNLSSYIAFYLMFEGEVFNIDKLLLFVVLYNALWIGASVLSGLYKIERALKVDTMVFRSIKIILLHFLIVNLFVQFYYDNDLVKYLMLSYFLILLVVPTSKGVMLKALLYYRTRGFNAKEIVILGSGDLANDLYEKIDGNPALGMRFKGFFDNGSSHNSSMPLYKGQVEELKDYCLSNKVDEIFCTLPMAEVDKINDIMDFADNHLIRFRLIPEFGALNKRMGISFYENVPVLTPRYEPLENTWNRVLKRGFDIVFSLAVISFIFPFLLPVVAILIKLSGRGPVFFRQLRTGKDNKSFYCYKFRTMTVNKDSDKMQAKKGDARITKIGAILRKTSLDEFPQFFNVLEGHMSIVGPRPHMLLHTEEYSKMINKFMVRHLIKPGITGWAQVSGYRGNTEESEMMVKRIEHDNWYVENWSLWLDIKIIFLTVINAVKGEENAF